MIAGVMILGLHPSIALVYLLCIAATILCVVYGAINWNKGERAPDEDDQKWVADEDKLEEEL